MPDIDTAIYIHQHLFAYSPLWVSFDNQLEDVISLVYSYFIVHVKLLTEDLNTVFSIRKSLFISYD